MFTVLSRHYIQRVKSIRSLIHAIRCCSDKPDDTQSKTKDKKIDDILGSIGRKYQVFRNEDSSVILDINEERFASLLAAEQEDRDIYEGINLERGVTGVYDIEDLVEVLKRENALNIFVTRLPPDLKYVDHICVVSGRSHRHMLAIAQFVRKVYKVKRNPKDILPKIEGENSKEWIALDLGNIALHIFSNEARDKYDLDSLWALGEEYDDECNKPDDPIVKLLQQHAIYLGDLEPADTKT